VGKNADNGRRPFDSRPIGRTLLALLVFSVVAAAPYAAAAPAIETGGRSFGTWADFYNSQLFFSEGRRCGTPPSPKDTYLFADPSDCSASSTNPTSEYDGPNVYEITVVWHVIQNTSGQGNLSDSLIQSQIDILNEDFRALAGSPGSPGYDTRIQFKLATTDPSGNPTTGITRSTNDTWFEDGGSYWNSLAWDPTTYANVYSNNASGALGYVPFLPMTGGGSVGTAVDRIVVLWSAVGRNGPGGPPYDQGRTMTHEVGHYLGLEHTFNNGCGTASVPDCYSTGDLLCDTNAQNSPNYGCPTSASSCSSADPIRNYMNYTDDTCMWLFSQEQSRRMRCALTGYRAQLYEIVGGNESCGDDIIDQGEQCDGSATNTCPTGVCDPDCTCADPVCGNNVLETGEQCDGTDAAACPGECSQACECPSLTCPNGICDAGEDATTCPADCGCGAAGACGNEAPAGCWCDDQCASFGDCCPDICASCQLNCPATPTPAPSATPTPGPTATAGPTPTPTTVPSPSPTPGPEACNEPAADIPDGASSIEDSITLVGAAGITDIDVRVEISHSWVGDLAVDLIHEDTGTTRRLIGRPGVPGLGEFGCDADNIAVWLDDEASSAVEDECGGAPTAISGTFFPNNTLDAFDGEVVGGTWTLRVVDTADGDVGTLDRWCLRIEDDGIEPTPSPTATASPTPSPSPTSSPAASPTAAPGPTVSPSPTPEPTPSPSPSPSPAPATPSPSPSPTATAAPICGNGQVEAGEQCDDAAKNGTGASCCATDCTFKPTGPASCDANACTTGDFCNSGVCTPGSCNTGAACGLCGTSCKIGPSGCACLGF
jgi:subtilisin-like proprotein convertase family protein